MVASSVKAVIWFFPVWRQLENHITTMVVALGTKFTNRLIESLRRLGAPSCCIAGFAHPLGERELSRAQAARAEVLRSLFGGGRASFMRWCRAVPAHGQPDDRAVA
jgi:hypothetical protein